jgi:hypothetical protein
MENSFSYRVYLKYHSRCKSGNIQKDIDITNYSSSLTLAGKTQKKVWFFEIRGQTAQKQQEAHPVLVL